VAHRVRRHGHAPSDGLGAGLSPGVPTRRVICSSAGSTRPTRENRLVESRYVGASRRASWCPVDPVQSTACEGPCVAMSPGWLGGGAAGPGIARNYRLWRGEEHRAAAIAPTWGQR
jgi:hypothetical protein